MMKRSESQSGPEIVKTDDGYDTDGMYRWGGPKIAFSAESLKEYVDGHYQDLVRPVADRIQELRDWITDVLSPYVDGPISDELARKIFGRTLMKLTLTSGTGLYAFKEGVRPVGFLHDATDALRSIDELAKLVREHPSDTDRIVRCSLNIGMLVVRTELRALFGPEVLIAKRRRIGSMKGGKATTKWTSAIAKIARATFSEERRGKVSKSAAYRRTAARLKSEHGVSISAKTLERHLVKDTA